jgi:Icc protein
LHIKHDNLQQPIQLVQITDSHLGDQPSEPLLGMDTDASLEHVLQLVSQERDHIDVLLATGDISNGGSVASYQRFQQRTQQLASKALWLPGNHDQLPAMQQAVATGDELTTCVEIGNWQIVMMNSSTPGEVGGHFTPEEMKFLRDCLEQSTGRYVLICLHHHPIKIGSDWLDEQQLANSDEFFALLDEFDHVRGVLWGHIHQPINQIRKGVQLMATPSSCVQFAPGSPSFKLSRLNPGYRWLELYADGRLETEVSRVKNVEFDIDYEYSSGY